MKKAQCRDPSSLEDGPLASTGGVAVINTRGTTVTQERQNIGEKTEDLGGQLTLASAVRR